MKIFISPKCSLLYYNENTICYREDKETLARDETTTHVKLFEDETSLWQYNEVCVCVSVCNRVWFCHLSFYILAFTALTCLWTWPHFPLHNLWYVYSLVTIFCIFSHKSTVLTVLMVGNFICMHCGNHQKSHICLKHDWQQSVSSFYSVEWTLFKW